VALGIYFAPAAMSAAQYDACIAALKKAGAHHPPGRTYHSSFGPAEKLAVFDVWTSQQAFDKFGQVLMPILAQLGIDPGQPMVMPIHNTIVPPAKAAKPAKKKARPAAKKVVKRRKKK
jgi:hypothetical protein